MDSDLAYVRCCADAIGDCSKAGTGDGDCRVIRRQPCSALPARALHVHCSFSPQDYYYFLFLFFFSLCYDAVLGMEPGTIPNTCGACFPTFEGPPDSNTVCVDRIPPNITGCPANITVSATSQRSPEEQKFMIIKKREKR
jgi:hypothetical protein